MNKQKFKPVHIKYLLFSLAAVLIYSSCAEDGVFNESRQTIIPESKEIVRTTIYAKVIDEQGEPIAGATVTLNSGLQPKQAFTNEEGYFHLRGIDNKGTSAFVSVTFAGKFDAFRRFSLLPGRTNYTEIMMPDKKVAGSLDASSGGSVSLSSGAQVSIPAGAVVGPNETVFSGKVYVAMSWVDPSSTDLSRRMIGDLSGIDENGQLRSLSTFGMLQVELFDDAGNELNLNDRGARLKFPIPPVMKNGALDVIPLWSYDERLGTWIQEGSAVLDGSYYLGEVYHFSSYNVDFMSDPIEVKGQVLWDTEGGSVGGSFLSIYVCSEKIGRKGGWLCEDGSFRFYNFPKDEEFKIKIYDYCNDQIYQESFGPFAENKDLGVIEVSINEHIIKVTGNAVNCDNIPVENAVLSVLQDGRNLTYPVNNDGTFEFGLNVCGEQNFILNLVDLDSEKSFSLEVNLTGDTLSLIDIVICEELNDFISFEIDNNPSVLLTPNVRHYTYLDSSHLGEIKQVTKIFYEAEFTSEATYFEMRFCTPDSIPAITEILTFRYSNNQLGGFFAAEAALSATITKYEASPGGAIEGSFEGNIYKETNTGIDTMFITGNFKVPIL